MVWKWDQALAYLLKWGTERCSFELQEKCLLKFLSAKSNIWRGLFKSPYQNIISAFSNGMCFDLSCLLFLPIPSAAQRALQPWRTTNKTAVDILIFVRAAWEAVGCNHLYCTVPLVCWERFFGLSRQRVYSWSLHFCAVSSQSWNPLGCTNLTLFHILYKLHCAAGAGGGGSSVFILFYVN